MGSHRKRNRRQRRRNGPLPSSNRARSRRSPSKKVTLPGSGISRGRFSRVMACFYTLLKLFLANQKIQVERGRWRSVEAGRGLWRQVEAGRGLWRQVEAGGGLWRSVDLYSAFSPTLELSVKEDCSDSGSEEEAAAPKRLVRSYVEPKSVNATIKGNKKNGIRYDWNHSRKTRKWKWITQNRGIFRGIICFFLYFLKN